MLVNQKSKEKYAVGISSMKRKSVKTFIGGGFNFTCVLDGPRITVGRAPDSSVRGPEFDTQSGHILLFLLPLIQEGQLSVTGESMCMKYTAALLYCRPINRGNRYNADVL